MAKKLVHDISANTLQVVVNQLCGLGIFYVLSTHLDKNNFGEINWSLAVLLTTFGILACGVDQVFVKRIASGHDEKTTLSIYISHVLLSGLCTYGLLLVSQLIFPSFFQKHSLLLLLGIGKMMIFFSTPFKQLATGLEKFRPLLFMSICSNVVRSIALLLFATLGSFDLTTVVIIFIAGDVAELLLCLYITQRTIKIPVLLKWDKREYSGLLKESFPQLGVAIFTSIITRFDWIFLGLFTTNIILAEYSFAYKIFEMATLPMLVLAPILIPRFTKIFHPSAAEPTLSKTNDLFTLLRMEMVIASLTALVLYILWVPVIDFATQGKYGAVNQHTIFILSASMPFLYLNNFLWTINFAKGRLKMIFYVFAITFVINVVADIVLIPLYKAEGAAIGYLLAIIGQSIAYVSQTNLNGLRQNAFSVLICPVCAMLSVYLASLLFINVLLLLTFAILFFILLLALTRQLKPSDRAIIKRVFKR